MSSTVKLLEETIGTTGLDHTTSGADAPNQSMIPPPAVKDAVAGDV
ncbi:hypothetical protein HY745_05540 [Candidatus Desantisbacteria bacterium]|nr:hypothetical protein [Candidatus Desantisbacteria bacterium]